MKDKCWHVPPRLDCALSATEVQSSQEESQARLRRLTSTPSWTGRYAPSAGDTSGRYRPPPMQGAGRARCGQRAPSVHPPLPALGSACDSCFGSDSPSRRATYSRDGPACFCQRVVLFRHGGHSVIRLLGRSGAHLIGCMRRRATTSGFRFELAQDSRSPGPRWHSGRPSRTSKALSKQVRAQLGRRSDWISSPGEGTNDDEHRRDP